MFIVGWASAGVALPAGPMAGRGLRPGRQRLAERQSHRGDLLLLGDDDFLRDPSQLFVVAEVQLGLSHGDGTLVVRDHHRREVGIDMAGRLDLHADDHLRHRPDILSEERCFLRRGRAEPRRANRRDVLCQGRRLAGVG